MYLSPSNSCSLISPKTTTVFFTKKCYLDKKCPSDAPLTTAVNLIPPKSNVYLFLFKQELFISRQAKAVFSLVFSQRLCFYFSQKNLCFLHCFKNKIDFFFSRPWLFLFLSKQKVFLTRQRLLYYNSPVKGCLLYFHQATDVLIFLSRQLLFFISASTNLVFLIFTKYR